MQSQLLLLQLSFGIFSPQSPLLSCIQIEAECVDIRAGKRLQSATSGGIAGNSLGGGLLACVLTLRCRLKPLVNEGMEALPQFLHSRLSKLGGPDALTLRLQIEIVGRFS